MMKMGALPVRPRRLVFFKPSLLGEVLVSFCKEVGGQRD
jgi:hypothetical protein